MKRHLCSRLALVTLILSSVWLGCDGSPTDSDVDNTNFVASEDFYYSVGLDAQSNLRLNGVSGNVTVRGVAGTAKADSVVVAGEKRVRSDSVEDAEDHLQYLSVEVEELSNEVRVTTEQPDQPQGRQYEVDYEITLPEDLMVIVGQVNGNIGIESIQAPVSVSNVNGWIVLDQISGSTSVNLTNGVVAGAIDIPTDGTIQMQVVNGSIDLAIPKETSAMFYAGVTNGNVSTSDLVIHETESTQTSISGRLGDGRGSISLTVTNGNISVTGF